MAGAASAAWATQWEAIAGAESYDQAREALAFLPNEIWVHPGDSIQWTVLSHEHHTITFLKPGQTRPAAFGPTFGVLTGCPGITPQPASVDGSACVTSDALLLPTADSQANAPTYTVSFPTAGNFKFVCLFHADMTGTVHVIDVSHALPHDQTFYDQEAQSAQAALLSEASSLGRRNSRGSAQNTVAAGAGAIVTMTGAGTQTAVLMRFLRDTITVHVGDTVEWANLDPSISHTVTFGPEPTDPRPASATVTVSSDGAREAVISAPFVGVNSGFLSPTPQDRANLAQAAPNITRFRVTFKYAGVFNYICAIHDDLNMKGTVIVNP
jgi:plastocyanin